MSPTAAPTPCINPACAALTTHGGYCSKCRDEGHGYAKERASPREMGYGQRWRVERRQHLADEPFCRYCGPGHGARAVDHVIPHQGAEWLFWIRDNWQSLCISCHNRKSAGERTIPVGMIWPIDLPAPRRPVRLLVNPKPLPHCFEPKDGATLLDARREAMPIDERNARLREELGTATERGILVVIGSPRAGERAYWSHVCGGGEPVIVGPPDTLRFADWWKWYRLDLRAEEAIAARRG